MNGMTLRKAALLLVAVSFALCTAVIVADVGISHTPHETTDSAGRKMGFNDPLSVEHCWIMLSNFRVQKLFAPVYICSWFLLVMHGVAAWLLLRGEPLSRPGVRWFFALQGALFPLGWLGFLALPWIFRSLLKGSFDRETMIDVPFIALTAHPISIATVMTIFAASWSASARSERCVTTSA
jgi:hypothetical protein